MNLTQQQTETRLKLAGAIDGIMYQLGNVINWMAEVGERNSSLLLAIVILDKVRKHLRGED